MHTDLRWWDSERIRWYEQAAAYSPFHSFLAGEIGNMVPRSKRILELGCGLGHTAEILFHNGYGIEATDIDETAIEAARRRSGLDIYRVLDADGPLPRSDTILMLYFGRIAERRNIEHFLSYADEIIYAVSHHTGVCRSRRDVSDDTEEYLKEMGFPYERHDVSFGFPQPLSSMEDARNYIERTYGKENAERILPLLEEGEDHHYVLPNTKSSAIFMIRRR